MNADDDACINKGGMYVCGRKKERVYRRRRGIIMYPQHLRLNVKDMVCVRVQAGRSCD